MKRLLFALTLLVGAVAPALAEGDIEPAVPVRTAPPEYPEELRAKAVEGVVVVAFTVDEKGNVADPQVEKCTRSEFEKPAVEAVKKWKFKPARQNGTPIARRVSVPIHFAVQK